MTDNLTVRQMYAYEKYRCKSKAEAMCTIRRDIDGKGTVREDLWLALHEAKTHPSPREYLHELFCAKTAKQRSQCV